MKGLADRYPGDRGIARAPGVLFADDFAAEAGDDLARRWTNVKNPGDRVFAYAADAPSGSASRRSLQMSATVGVDEGGFLYQQLPRGVETLHARFYVQFAEDADYIHHFVALGGYQPATPWPQGGAGERPRGDDRLSVEVGPHTDEGRLPPPGYWGFYNYWHEMQPDGHGQYWGNLLYPETRQMIPRGRWQCVEVMVRLNTMPETPDGALALWLDGRRVLQVQRGTRLSPPAGRREVRRDGTPFEGFRWRRSRELKLNYFWLQHYVTEALFQRLGKRPHAINRVWFANVVLATEYIGPLAKG